MVVMREVSTPDGKIHWEAEPLACRESSNSESFVTDPFALRVGVENKGYVITR